jgi:hypothetical protein
MEFNIEQYKENNEIVIEDLFNKLHNIMLEKSKELGTNIIVTISGNNKKIKDLIPEDCEIHPDIVDSIKSPYASMCKVIDSIAYQFIICDTFNNLTCTIVPQRLNIQTLSHMNLI